MSFASIVHRDAAILAVNIRRIMVRQGMTFEDVTVATGLDSRTLRAIVRGKNTPHARTLHKLAHGLGVSIDELFCPPQPYSARQFDRATNTLVERIVTEHGKTFEKWTNADFDELFSRFGTGGQLTEAGVLAAAEIMNVNRDVRRQVSVILESGEAKLLSEFVEMLYRRVTSGPVTSVDKQQLRNC